MLDSPQLPITNDSSHLPEPLSSCWGDVPMSLIQSSADDKVCWASQKDARTLPGPCSMLPEAYCSAQSLFPRPCQPGSFGNSPNQLWSYPIHTYFTPKATLELPIQHWSLAITTLTVIARRTTQREARGFKPGASLLQDDCANNHPAQI